MKVNQNLNDAINSMLRTDYIPIDDTRKLNKLSEYYVDYFGYLQQILDNTDQIIVGRRGTGKTTLLYRALIECVNSWKPKNESLAKKRTLGVYLDLSKCQSLSNDDPDVENNIEHVFATELYEALDAELKRDWPSLAKKKGLLHRLIVSNDEAKTNLALKEIASIIKSGIPRSITTIGPHRKTDSQANEFSENYEVNGTYKSGIPGIGAKANNSSSNKSSSKVEHQEFIQNRLLISDILRAIGKLKEAAKIDHVVLLIDELSSLSENQQRKFTTLLRKILGNHNGVYVKLCGITDNYKLGSSIIVQRDIFELCLDFDRFVEMSDSTNSAFLGLEELSEKLVSSRLKAFTALNPSDLFDNPKQTWQLLSKSCVSIPRTIGIVLKHAYQKSQSQNKNKIRIIDIESGIRYASSAYMKQFEGSSGDLIPEFHLELQNKIVDYLILQKTKGGSTSPFFMVKSAHEDRLRYLNMFFLIHLITKGRTTKKEKIARNVYMLDYGICLENNIEFTTDKNIIRQQRFVLDEVLEEFDEYFTNSNEQVYICPKCRTEYKESQIRLNGRVLDFCPQDRETLEVSELSGFNRMSFTEEEIKIIGAIRSATEDDELLARQVADDVGCYVQKVAKFGEKAENQNLIKRKLNPITSKLIYFRRNKK